MLGVLTANDLNVVATCSTSLFRLSIPYAANLSRAANVAFSRTVRLQPNLRCADPKA